jgi:hypothetical protein
VWWRIAWSGGTVRFLYILSFRFERPVLVAFESRLLQYDVSVSERQIHFIALHYIRFDVMRIRVESSRLDRFLFLTLTRPIVSFIPPLSLAFLFASSFIIICILYPHYYETPPKNLPPRLPRPTNPRLPLLLLAMAFKARIKSFPTCTRLERRYVIY